MKNLKNEGDSSPILRRSTRRIQAKPLETRQIPLPSPCAKCGEGSGKLGAGRQPRESSLHCAKCGSFIKWVSASELRRIEKSLLLIELHQGTFEEVTLLHKATPDDVTEKPKPTTASESEHLCISVSSEHLGFSNSKTEGGEV